MNYHFEDFTEKEYRNLLRIAKANWEFVPFIHYKRSGRICLWRHDVDFSVHRAHRLAQIEAEEGVKATYFVLMHSEFYNAMESEVATLILDILDLGHDLGLHFDPTFYTPELQSGDTLIDLLQFEQHALGKVFQTDIRAFSFHNPDLIDELVDQDEICGMVNAYGQYIKTHFGYCSDSNGYWRFRRLRDVVEEAEDERVHVLTHPTWWVPGAMSPRARIARCIEGRAAKTAEWYDRLLAEMGRENVR